MAFLKYDKHKYKNKSHGYTRQDWEEYINQDFTQHLCKWLIVVTIYGTINNMIYGVWAKMFETLSFKCLGFSYTWRRSICGISVCFTSFNVKLQCNWLGCVDKDLCNTFRYWLFIGEHEAALCHVSSPFAWQCENTGCVLLTSQTSLQCSWFSQLAWQSGNNSWYVARLWLVLAD